jgi:hypothetical protein
MFKYKKPDSLTKQKYLPDQSNCNRAWVNTRKSSEIVRLAGDPEFIEACYLVFFSLSANTFLNFSSFGVITSVQ